MKFYQKLLKYDSTFLGLSPSEKENYLTIFKHKHFAYWFAYVFSFKRWPIYIAIASCFMNLILFVVFNNLAIFVITALCLSYSIAILILNLFILYQVRIEHIAPFFVSEILFENFLKLWLLNSRVISLKDWYSIKKNNPELFKKATTEESFKHCYDITFELANELSNPDLKIVWLAAKADFAKAGHAVLEKNGYVYDTSTKKTYKTRKYYSAMRATKFKSFDISKYSSSDFFSKYWDVFDIWCSNQNVVRSEPLSKKTST